MIDSQREILDWIYNGKKSLTPHLYKEMTLLEFARRFQLVAFVETGTYLGDMVEAMRNYFSLIISIELGHDLFSNAKRRFMDQQNISILLGDSGRLMPEVLQYITFPCLFWLDGHYSAGITAKGNLNTPILRELNSIFNHTVKNHVILIDDARLFNGQDDYPSIEELRDLVMQQHDYILEVQDDIIRISPNSPLCT